MKVAALKFIQDDEKGFTLIETLVAMGIFSIVMLATATMLFTGMSASASGNNRTIASSVAQKYVDNLMTMPFANIANYTPTLATDTAAGRLDTVDGRSYRTRWTVTNHGTNPLSPVMRGFIVTTTWTDKAGVHTLTINGLRSPWP